jgi:hypothetical protein
LEAFEIAGYGNETEAMGEHLVVEHGSVVLDEDVFHSEYGDFGDEDAAEGICEGGVEVDEGELGVVGVVFDEFDGEVLGMWVREGMERGVGVVCTLLNFSKSHS